MACRPSKSSRCGQTRHARPILSRAEGGIREIYAELRLRSEHALYQRAGTAFRQIHENSRRLQGGTGGGTLDVGGISWRAKPDETPRTAGIASTPAVADFWAARVWLRWERSLGAPCRYPVTAPEFRAHTHRRAQLPRLPRRRDRNT